MKHRFGKDELWLKRFWAKVDKSPANPKGCWLWTAATSGAGYGVVQDPSRKGVLYAHRVSFTLAGKQYSPGKGSVLHSCDTPACVNPDHLRAGSQQDNIDDMVRAGRSAKGEKSGHHTCPGRMARGERHGHSKLTESSVRLIREMYHTGGVTYKDLASQFGVSASTVGDIVRGDAWPQLL